MKKLTLTQNEAIKLAKKLEYTFRTTKNPALYNQLLNTKTDVLELDYDTVKLCYDKLESRFKHHTEDSLKSKIIEYLQTEKPKEIIIDPKTIIKKKLS